MTINVQTDNAVRGLDVLGMEERILFSSYSFMAYIGKFFVPHPLYAFYGYTNISAIPSWYYGMPILALALTGVVIWLGRKNKFIWFGFFFFLLVISISLQLVTAVGGAMMADRYTYIPYIGLGIALLMGVSQFLEKKKNLEKPLLVVGIAFLAVLAALTWRQTETWKDGESLWSQVIKHADPPARISYTNRGDYYKSLGNGRRI